jgi:hypothetical protein
MRSTQRLRFGILLLTPIVFSGMCGLGEAAENDSASTIFERRIMPIFKSPNPSSCTQCHLAGVELKNYILPSSEKTFLSLRDQGLIDLAQPDNSKILKLINMRDTENSGADLIHEKTRQAEYDAFSGWIKACAADQGLVSLPKLTNADLAKPKRPVEVIRHGRKDALLESFENNIWAMRFRCMSCHIEGTPENTKLKGEYGDRVAWMKSAGAAATMDYLTSSKLIDVRKPENSLLILKPLKAVDHGGGKKFLMGDQGYQAFRSWLEEYAKTVGDKYATAAALPKTAGQPSGFGTNLWLKLTNTPPAWGDSLVQTDIFAWDDAAKSWEEKPIATSDRQNSSKGRIWQHTLTLLADKDSDRAKGWQQTPRLPAGRYLVKVSVGAGAKPSDDWRASLTRKRYLGEAEFTSNWSEGSRMMTVVDAGAFRPIR